MPLDRKDDPLVTIAWFDTVFDACVARGALEAIGIRALVPEEIVARGSTFTPGTLQVFQSDSACAVTELGRMQMRVLSSPPDDGEPA